MDLSLALEEHRITHLNDHVCTRAAAIKHNPDTTLDIINAVHAHVHVNHHLGDNSVIIIKLHIDEQWFIYRAHIETNLTSALQFRVKWNNH